jgi:hypothetical protein
MKNLIKRARAWYAKWFRPRRSPSKIFAEELKPCAEVHPVVFSYTEEEAAMLFDLLYSEMKELMSMNTKDRLSEEPMFDQEQRDYLHRVMQFCVEQLKVLIKYAK